MEDTVDANNSKRVIRSRKNTRGEKLKQNKEWKKRVRERQRVSAETTARQEANAAANSATNEQRKPSSPSQKCSSKDAKQCNSSAAINEKPEKHLEVKTFTRGAMMLQMARGANVIVNSLFTKPPPRRLLTVNANRNFGRIEKQRAIYLKELSPEHLEYLSAHPIGSGSYGQCFSARYRGIDALVKKMKHNETAEEKERAMKNLIHEAEVVSTLGDHDNLPMMLGVVTESEPLYLVTQFHGVEGNSITLHQAADTNTLTPPDCTEIFHEICSALKHVHRQGYLHNDIKANNVVLQPNSKKPEKYKPVLIDFGKSTKAAGGSVSVQRRKKRTAPGKSYLAPEVLKDRLYSSASDVYSLGRMLKSIASMVGFYPSVRALVKEATSEIPSLRPRLDDFMQKLNAVKF